MPVSPTCPEDPAQPQPFEPSASLYDPAQHHDACGVGFVATLTNEPSHEIVRQGLTILERLDHRGAYGCDEASGDGAGILVQIPHAFLKARLALRNVRLPRRRQYAVGVVFLPKDFEAQQGYQKLFHDAAYAEGIPVLGWRPVPVNSGILGPIARSNEPAIAQVVVGRPKGLTAAEYERRLFVLCRRATKAANAYMAQYPTVPGGFHLISLSSRTLIYKGMLIPEQLSGYFPDLREPDFASALAVVHSRFSTNTLPEWHLAQPFRMLCHNGEINTVRGNRNWWGSREALFSSEDFGADLDQVRPVMTPGDSDSKSLDAAIEVLVHGGRSLPEAVMLMVPEAWQHAGEPGADVGGRGTMDDARKAFYEYHACLMEPWDGPATIPFTDGRYLGAVLDRNGLRPSRYTVTDDGLVVLSSETGVLDLDPARVTQKGRLEPGRMLLLDLKAGRIIDDAEVKAHIAKKQPYRQWLDQHLVPFSEVVASVTPRLTRLNGGQAVPLTSEGDSSSEARTGGAGQLPLRTRQRLFGVTLEDLTLLLPPMARNGKEALGSMGDDTPLAVLSDKPRLLYDYFRQNFAQVTNPPLDAIREELVTALSIHLGATGNLLAPAPEACRVIRLDQPILTQADLAALRAFGDAHEPFRIATLDAMWTRTASSDAGDALRAGLDALCAAADAAIDAGATILVLSDEMAGPDRVPIPALLAAGAVHHHLVRTLRRGCCELVVETQEAREVHHMACLLGHGATAICPTLALDTIRDAAERTGDDPAKAEANYVKALGKGLLKVMSKMGISTLQSYQSAQQFEALGLARSVVDAYFTGTPTRIEGADLTAIADEALRRHASAFQPTHRNGVSALDVGGRYGWRREGERHHYAPASIGHLQHAVRTGSFESYQQFADAVDLTNSRRGTLRSLLEFADDESRAVPLSEVEPWTEIVKRFKTGAMSYGSISAEAHETLAVAMNRLGGKSNTGEGGEDPTRYARSHAARSAIKQVASGRFGVTIDYLAGADEIQIKMAQGAKPGEGGQLPGKKVNDEIARTRHSTPGVGLISPPPHHDIYSIEDLAQLIHDLKNTRPKARISVKLVAQAGVGTVAAGVAKAKADVILISGSDGGTGASPQTSVAHTGLPWELGLSEAQQALVATGLRNRVTVECDGHLKTGRDVAVAALLGAQEFGFATAPLVAMGCVMMRKCHLNVCPVGIATQHPALRKKFAGTPEHVIEYFHFVAQDLRRIMARLGFRTVEEMVGRVDRLRRYEPIGAEADIEAQRPSARKRAGLDLRPILAQPHTPEVLRPYVVYEQDHGLAVKYDHWLIDRIEERFDPRLGDVDDPADLEPLTLRVAIKNTQRSFGTMLSGAMARRVLKYARPYRDDAVTIWATGSAGQSFGAFGIRGLTLHVEGDANDYLGKGLSGATISVRPHAGATFVPEDNVIIGNVALYGATSGRLYVRGKAGERFAVRNSGAWAVVEGVGDHGCEYMTGGRVVVLGRTGRNFAAGMSGGLAYVFDGDGRFGAERCNLEMVDLFAVDPASDDARELRALVQAHAKATRSDLAARLLVNWKDALQHFVKVYPTEYRRALEGPTGSGDGIASDRDLARYTVRISGRDWRRGDREKRD